MKHLKIAGGCLVVVFALSGTVAASASAELPELGRCLKVAPVVEGKKETYGGSYVRKNCVRVSATKTGRYEWTPGPGVNNMFSGLIVNEPTLETVGGIKLSCSSVSLKGEYTGPKTEKVTLKLQGCHDQAERACQTLPAPEGVIETTQALEGDLAFIDKTATRTTVGWDLKREGALFTYSCGKVPEALHTVEGSVIGRLLSGALSDYDRMSILSTIKYTQVKGKQVPEAFEGLPKDTLTTTTTGIEKLPNEQTGLSGTDENVSGLGAPVESEANQEPLEVKAISR